jgi:membrane protein YdbS with pleckstrin-like domain
LGKEYEEARVIKPPGEKITSGRVFKPSKALRNKMWLEQILVALSFYGMFLFFVGGVGTLIGLDDPSAFLWLQTYWLSLNIGMWIFNLVWLLPALVLTPLYVGRIEYSVIAESGETMPEVYVRKGIISITRKHVPFRTITNISTTAGPFDRLFGIGNVNIETAGYSGKKSGPEEKLEGFEFYEELRDFILQELRKFRAPYVTGTEVVRRHEEPVPRFPDSLDDEILLTLREMRKILLEIAKTLKKR